MPTISNASKYTIDSDNRVFREGRLVKSNRSPNGVFAKVVCDDGVQRRLNIAKQSWPKFALLNQQHILGKLNAKTHHDFPDYAVTCYGDIYCLRESKSGIHANGCYAVPDFLHGPSKKRYVSIRRPDGKRYQIRLAKFVRQVWGANSQFNDDE